MNKTGSKFQINHAQRQAVEYIDGPLLVLAGPGTGKTELLSERAAHILKATDTNPENILCLTYTDKAALNMRERLLANIGPEARKIAVHTFHGLGAEIFNAYPDYFWQNAKLRPAPEAVQLEVVETILAGLPLNSPLALKFDGQLTLVTQVTKAISQLKRAGLTPTKLRAITDANLAYIDTIETLLAPLIEKTISKAVIEELRQAVGKLPDEGTSALTAPMPPLSKAIRASFATAEQEASESGKNTPFSTWKSRLFEKVGGQRVFKDRRRNHRWAEIAKVYKYYQEAMASGGYFDYDDMILEAINKLENEESLLTELQERFQYLMIDEFQDTNDAQFRLAYLIANHPVHEGKPNIMAVGDDDQAIYRFQGAELSNVQNFMDSFVDTEKVVLTENYRSHQSLLTQTATLAGQIEHRLINQLEGLDKNLSASSSAPKGELKHLAYASRTHQFEAVADLAQQLLEKGEVAILARRHDSLETLAALMHTKQVPVRYERSANVLDHEAVKLVTNLLQLAEYISSGELERANALAADLLPHPLWQLDAKPLWQFAVEQRYKPDWIQGLSQHPNKKFRAVGEWWMELARIGASSPLPVVIEHILGLRQSDAWHPSFKDYYLEAKPVSSSYVRTLSALQRLRSLANEYALGGEADLASFNQFIRLNQAHGVNISDESVFVSGDNAVNLMTVYKAKGLEFDSVIVIDAVDKEWKPKGAKTTPPLNLEVLKEYGEDTDDYARLMFVAASRSKSNLFFTSYIQDEHGQAVLASPLIHDVPLQTIEPSTTPPITAIEAALAWPELDQSDAQLALASVLEQYELPVTSLINFLDLQKSGPSVFLTKNLLRLPDIKSATLSFGTAMHETLRQAQTLANQDKLNGGLAKLTKVYKEALAQERLELADFERYLDHGTQLLARLMKSPVFKLPKGAQAERAIKHVALGTVRLQGKLDRLHVTNKTVEVTDYKTGAALGAELDNTSKTKGVKAWRHRTQIIYYALLLERAGLAKPGQTVIGQMIYLEAEQDRDFIRQYAPTQEDLSRMSKLVTSVWQHIQELDMPDIVGYSQDLDGITAFEDDLIAGKLK